MTYFKRFSVFRTAILTACFVLVCFVFALGAAFTGGMLVNADTVGACTVLSKVEVSQKNGYVFTDGLTDEQMLGLIDVTVTYSEPEGDEEAELATETYTLELDKNGVAETGERVTLAYSAGKLTVTVVQKSGCTVLTGAGTAVLNAAVGTPVINGITAIYTGSGGLKTSSSNPVSDIEVYYTWNNGTAPIVDSNKLSGDAYDVDGNLFPVSLPVSVGDTYTARLTVTMTGGERYSAEVDIPNVEFEAPTSISEDLGTAVLPTQTARSELNTGAITVTLVYRNEFGDRVLLGVPLSVFDSGIATSYYVSRSDRTPVETLSTRAGLVSIEFTYPYALKNAGGNNVASGTYDLTVSPISISTPVFPENTTLQTLQYVPGTSIEITGLLHDEFEADPPVPTVSVDTTAATGSASYAISGDGDSRTIEFKEPGQTYTVRIGLTENGDFQWNMPTFGGQRNGIYMLEYRVQVNKGKFEATLSGDFTWTYGGSSPVGEVSGELIGGTLTQAFTFDQTVPDVDCDREIFTYHLEYYGFDGYDADNRSTVAPKNAGKYFVVAVTHENECYESAVSDAVGVTVNPKVVSKNGVLINPEYDRTKSYGATDVLASGISGFEPGDGVPISVTGGAGVAFPLKYAGSYAVVLELTDTNYVWSAVTGEWNTVNDASIAALRKTDSTFTIETLELTYSVVDSSWYYGASTAGNGIAATPSRSDKFYATASRKFYKSDKTTEQTEADFTKWDSGTYYVVYTPVYDGNGGTTDADDKKSIKLVSSDFAEITVNKAQIQKINISDDNGRYYDSADKTFAFGNWSVGFVNGGTGKYADIDAVRTRSVVGARTGSVALGTGQPVTLDDADVYTVTVSLADKTNFEWSDGTDDDISATWTINKALVDKVTAPANKTYNHNAQSFTLGGNWRTGVMRITSVTGKSFGNQNIASDITFDGGDASVSVKLAGTYTVTVVLTDPDNYAWVTNDGSDDSAYAVTFDVLRATIALSASNETEVDFDDKTDMYFPVPKAQTALGTELSIAELSLAFNIINEAGDTVATHANISSVKISASGVYTYVFVTGYSGTEAANYVLPSELTLEFTVKSQDLIIPQFDESYSREYKGAAYDITQFILNYAEQQYGNRVVITVTRGGVVVSDIKDVYLVSGEEAAYTVSIVPSENYQWASGEPNAKYSFEVTVTRHKLTLDWDDDSLCSVYGDGVNPVCGVTDIFFDDDVSVVVKFRAGIVNGSSNAGTYMVYASELDGSAAHNYSFDSGSDKTYIIYKKGLAKPDAPTVSETYSGTNTVALSVFDDALVSAAVSAYRPRDWFDAKDGNRSIDVSDSTKYGYDVATGVFKYTDAGVYSVLFTILDSDNYCWNDGSYDTEKLNFANASSYTYSWTDFAVIARAGLTPPPLGDYRAIEWESFEPFTVPNTVSGLSLDVLYGDSAGNTQTNESMGESKATAIGLYFVQLSVNSADKLNYVWGKSSDNIPSFVTEPDTAKYTDTEVSIKMWYIITGSQLIIDYRIADGSNGYKFGDNGVVNGTVKYNGLDALFVLDENCDNYSTAVDIDRTLVDIEFFDGSGAAMDGDDANLFENGLPWKVGTYTVSFGVKFGDGTIYQTYPITKKFTVSKRYIEVVWADENTVVYNGADQVRSAELTNVPVKGGVKVAVPELEIYIKGTANKPRNANVNGESYTLAVGALSDNGSFTLDGAINNEATFYITPYDVAIKGIAQTHVYGDTLPSGASVAWEFVEYDGEARSFYSDLNPQTHIIVDIYDGNDFAGAVPSVGSGYTLRPRWDDGSAAYATNYAVHFDNTAAFTVTEREIRVTVTDGGVTRKYFDDVVDYTAIYGVANINGSGDPIVAGDDPFTLFSDVRKNSAVKLDGYAIYIAVTDGNYSVVINGITAGASSGDVDTGCKYIIEYADIDATVSCASFTYNASDYAYLTGSSVTVRNPDEITPTVYIAVVGKNDGAPAADSAAWKQYSSTADVVRDAGSYYFYVKVVAANHNDCIMADTVGGAAKPFAVVIAKAQLTVTLKFGIYYGEQKPEAVSFLMSKESLSDSRYTVVGLLGGDKTAFDADGSIEGLSGTFSYVTDYSVGSGSNRTYAITLDFGTAEAPTLTSKNYAFVGAEGVLTVNKVSISVSVSSVSSSYNGTVQTLDYTYEVTSPSTYTENAVVSVTDDEIKNIFALKTAALKGITVNGSTTTTAAVGEYPIYAVAVAGGASADYAVTFVGEKTAATVLPSEAYGEYDKLSFYTVTAATLTVNTVTPYGGDYDDNAHDALIIQKDNTVSHAVAETADGSAVSVKYYVYGGTDEIETGSVNPSELVGWTEHTTVPRVLNAGTYYVVYSITAANHTPVNECVKIVINKAHNSFTERFKFAFGTWTAVADGYDGTDGSQTAWVYGRYGTEHHSGYNANGDQRATQPETLLKLNCVAGATSTDGIAQNPIKITLEYRNGSAWQVKIANSTEAVNTVISDAFDNGTFVAGTYRLTFTVDGNDNYFALSESYLFDVAKKTLTVTPIDTETDYGESASYGVSISGFADNGGGAETLADIVGASTAAELLGKDSALWSFGGSAYSVGCDAGEYAIVVADINNAALFDNYILDCTAKGNLTVNKRTVTVTIVDTDAHNRYMLIGTYNDSADNPSYEVEQLGTYSAVVKTGVSGSYDSYYGDAPIRLETRAHFTEGGVVKTADVGRYAIYAVYNDETAKSNYNIIVENGIPTGVDTVIADGTDGALVVTAADGMHCGVFTIEKASLQMIVTGPYYADANGEFEYDGKNYTEYTDASRGIYDGKEKYRFATAALGAELLEKIGGSAPRFTPSYECAVGGTWQDMGADIPKNAGRYRVTFTPVGANSNFVAIASSSNLFTIDRRELSYSANISGGSVSGNRGVYNGSDYTVTFTFNGVVNPEVLKLDIGATGTRPSGKALSSAHWTVVKPSTEANGTFTFSAHEAGEYTITVALENNAAMENYTLVSPDEYSFAIDRATLYYWVLNSRVEYGTKIFNGGAALPASDRFDGFGVAYSLTNHRVTSTEESLENIINANIAAGNFVTKKSGVEYVATGYSDGSGSAKASNAGETFGIDMPNMSAENFILVSNGGTLTVIKRSVSVIVNGAKEANESARHEYAGRDTAFHNEELNKQLAQNIENALKGVTTVDGKAFVPFLSVVDADAYGVTGDNVKSLGVALTVSPNAGSSEVRNVGSYYISAAGTNGNYDITFVYKNIALGGSNSPVYEIYRKTLFVKVQPDTTADYVETVSAFTVTYGDNVAGLSVRYSGWVSGEGEFLLDGQRTAYSIMSGSKEYAAYESHVGEKYVIDAAASRFLLSNYEIVYKTANLEITPRTVTATTADRMYEKADDGYHGGAYGASKEAVITFGNVDTAYMLQNKDYALSYNTEPSQGQTKFAAPTKAGKYVVTVSIKANGVSGGTYYDYRFDDGALSCELDYNIEKRDLSLEWTRPTIGVSEADKQNEITAYRSSIMTVVSLSNGEVAIDRELCTVSDDGLIYVPSEPGTYTLIVEFIESAAGNYCWSDGGSQAVVRFEVTSEGLVEIKNVQMLGWTYAAYDNAANTPTAGLYVVGTSTQVTGEITYRYAKVNAWLNGNIDDITVGGNVINNYNSNNYEFGGSFEYNTPTDAGVYILRVGFEGDVNYRAARPVYYIFRVNKATVAAPTVADKVYTETDGVGNITVELGGYNAAAMQILSTEVHAMRDGDVVTLSAVNANAGGYKIVIGLANGNYTWTDGSTDNVTLTWVVSAAESNVVQWNPDNGYTYAYGTPFTITADTYPLKYNNVISYRYAVRTEGQTEADAASISESDWQGGFPVNAGLYWIRAVGRSANGNYNQAYAYHEFTITKVDLHVTPTGAMVYGSTFGNGYCSSEFTLSDLVNGDTETIVRRSIRNAVYTVTDAPASGVWGAKAYTLTVTAEATNYNIISEQGTFTVNKAQLFVTLGRNAQSQYGKPVNLSDTSVSVNGLIPEDEGDDTIIAAIRAALVSDATATSNVNTYTVSLRSGFTLDNYTVTATNGIYTITKLPVTVSVDWGGYRYGTTAVLPTVTAVLDGATDIKSDVLPHITFMYNGSVNVPTVAGSYAVAVQLDENCNYTLLRAVAGTFVISQTELDASLIVWETVYYTGTRVTPRIAEITGNAFSADEFDVEYVGDWDKAGVTYTIVLTLKNTANTKWLSVEGAVRELTYSIERGKNELTQPISISDWVYGEYDADINAPFGAARFGTVVFEYSDAENGVYTTSAPAAGSVGEYFVRAVVSETTDYERLESAPVKFNITKASVAAPSVAVITSGYGKNDVYTGEAMHFTVVGFDSTRMYIRYDFGLMTVDGNYITVIATNAGDYYVTVSLVDSRNYKWADGVTVDDDGRAILPWSIARKKLTKPVANDNMYIVNGKIITYYPVGFDAETMEITGNASGYGGEFTAEITLRDPDNYEWAEWIDNPAEAVRIEWSVVGANTVFVVLISVLSVATAAAAVGVGVQLAAYLKKKKAVKADNGGKQA